MYSGIFYTQNMYNCITNFHYNELSVNTTSHLIQKTRITRRARCCTAWTPCRPSSGATSTRTTAGSSRSSASGRSSSARRLRRRASPPRPWRSPTPVPTTRSKRLSSRRPSRGPPPRSRTREPLQSLNNRIRRQRRIRSPIPERRRKVCKE